METSKYISCVKGHALVLGGSGGIGREVVLALVAAGASAISYSYSSNKAGAELLRAELEKAASRKYFSTTSISLTKRM